MKRDVVALGSGVTVVYEQLPEAASAAAGWFVPLGSRDEPPGMAGVAHFLEHLAFKGDERNDADAVNQALDALGARANAYTSEDRTAYFGTVLPERLPQLLRLLAMLSRPALRPDDVELERAVILEEIAMANDDPESRVADLAAAFAHQGHPLAQPILGTVDSVAGIDREALRCWRDVSRRPDRLVIALAGSFELDAAIEAIEEASGDPPGAPQETGGPMPHAPLPRTPPAWRYGEVRRSDPGLRRRYGALLAPGVPHDSNDRYAATLLAQGLGEPEHGLLHWELVEPGLADQVGLVHETADGFGRYAGWYGARAETGEQVTVRVRELLNGATPDLLDPDVWRRAARSWATDVTLDAETPFGRMMALADSWIERRELHDPEKEAASILASDVSAGRRLLQDRPFDRLAEAIVTGTGGT